MSTKNKFAVLFLALLAGLFVFLVAERQIAVARVLVPIGILGFLAYCAWSLLRSKSNLESTDTDERCGDDCGCKNKQPVASKKGK